MRVMKAKLYEVEQRKERRRVSKHRGGERRIFRGGARFRSYVFQPYQMVKDHRTDHESGNLAAVMDGALDPFIEAYLTMKASNKIQASPERIVAHVYSQPSTHCSLILLFSLVKRHG